MIYPENTVGSKMISSCILMLALLSWLMFCLPFVHESHKATKAKTEQNSKDIQANEEQPDDSGNENANPNLSPVLEYLSDVSKEEQHFITIRTFSQKLSFDLKDGYLSDHFIPPPTTVCIGVPSRV